MHNMCATSGSVETSIIQTRTSRDLPSTAPTWKTHLPSPPDRTTMVTMGYRTGETTGGFKGSPNFTTSRWFDRFDPSEITNFER